MTVVDGKQPGQGSTDRLRITIRGRAIGAVVDAPTQAWLGY